MAFDLGSLMVSVGADLSDLERGLKKSTQMIQRTGREMQMLGAKLSVAVTAPLALIGRGAIQAASDAAEMQAKFRTVFRDLTDDTEKWAADTAKATGQSRFALQEYLATLQDTFVPLGFARKEAAEMSKTLTQLAVDLASFNNMNTADVVRDLQSALVGNTETLRKYGVVAQQTQIQQKALEMGYTGSLQAIDAQTKAAAILAITLESTTDAQGDAVRTADSFANQMKALRASVEEVQVEIGTRLIPVVLQFVQRARDAVDAVKNLDPAVLDLGVKFGILAASLPLVISALGTLAVHPFIAVSAALVGTIGILATKFERWQDAVATLPGPLGGAVAWTKILVEWVGRLAGVSETASEKLTRLAQSAPKGTFARSHGDVFMSDPSTPGAGGGGGGSAGGGNAERQTQAISKYIETLKVFTGGLEDAFQKPRDALAELNTNTDALQIKMRETGEVADSGFLQRVINSASEVKTVLAELGAQFENYLTGAVMSFGDIFESQMDRLFDAARKGQRGVLTIGNAFKAMAGSAVQSIAVVIRAIRDQIVASMAAKAAAAFLSGNIIGGFKRLAGAAAVAATLSAAASGVSALGKQVSEIPQLASGGIVRRPTLAMIGESGPEAVVPLSRMSQPQMQPVLRVGIGELYVELDRYGRENGLGMGR